MAFTMHSHSGQFCPGHAQDQLEDIVKHAISIGYRTMGLTEHMPRYSPADLYPEEVVNPLPPTPFVLWLQTNNLPSSTTQTPLPSSLPATHPSSLKPAV